MCVDSSLQTQDVLALVIVGVAVMLQGGIDMGLGPVLPGATPQDLIGRTQ